MIRPFALFTLLALAGCTSLPPSVAVIHTYPPKFNIMPAKRVAVIGDAKNAEEREHEGDFIDLVLSRLRRYEQYDVKDERELAYGINKGRGFFEAAEWQQYLDQSAGEVIVKIGVPDEDCRVYEKTRDDGSEDADDVVGWTAECREYLDLLRPRTGERIGSVTADGYGTDPHESDALADAMSDAADQIIGGFAPLRYAELVALDQDAPLVREGLQKFESRDYDGALALWENALAASPGSAPLLYNLGALCDALQDSRAAGAYYLRAIAAAPQVPRYRKALAQLHQRLADADEAARDPAVNEARKAAAVKEAAADMATMAIDIAGIPYLPIPAGSFTMGCTKGDQECRENETPAHAVTISKPFYVAQTPVTNEQYQRCIDAGVCRGKSDATAKLEPVVSVTWSDARDFCAWSGGRLPTEAEWEYAARGGMTGNLSQWTADWTNDYPDAAVTDPAGPPTGEKRVVRRGSRLSARYSAPPDSVQDTLGFRCVALTAGPPL